MFDTGARELDSKLKGACLRTNAVTYAYVSSCPAGTGKYLLSTSRDREWRCLRGEVIHTHETGTEMKIHRVMRQGRGASGSCLRIEVVVEDKGLPGGIADIPVCGLLHPRPFWITQGFDQVSEIVFDEEFVVLTPCSE